MGELPINPTVTPSKYNLHTIGPEYVEEVHRIGISKSGNLCVGGHRRSERIRKNSLRSANDPSLNRKYGMYS